ncbi:hypothetical protein LEMLEM_LOCUS16548, partial [Lemmus lemmus]
EFRELQRRGCRRSVGPDGVQQENKPLNQLSEDRRNSQRLKQAGNKTPVLK